MTEPDDQIKFDLYLSELEGHLDYAKQITDCKAFANAIRGMWNKFSSEVPNLKLPIITINDGKAFFYWTYPKLPHIEIEMRQNNTYDWCAWIRNSDIHDVVGTEDPVIMDAPNPLLVEWLRKVVN